ncbi:MAG TPA: hypothetical protein VES20_01740, partial [Bryobacteraceae bacterium]|nr:hypothetical protein [Bryobacteraceae bacterium]
IVCTFAALLSLVTSLFRDVAAGIALLVFCAVTVLLVRSLGYVEFKTLGRLVSQGTVINMVGAEIALAEFEKKLAGSRSLEQAWDVLCEGCKLLGFSRIELWIDGQILEKRLAPPDPRGSCMVRILLPGDCYAECERPLEDDRGGMLLTSFARILCAHLPAQSASHYSAKAASL